MEKFLNILEIKAIKNDDLKIANVQYLNKSKKIILSITGKNILALEIFEELEMKMKNFLEIDKDISFQISYTVLEENSSKSDENQINENELEKYYQKILKENKSLNNTLGMIKIKSQKNEIVFELNAKYEEKIIQNLIPQLQEEYKSYGFENIKISFHLDNVDKKKKEIEEKILKNEEEISIKAQKENTNKPKVVFGGEQNGKVFLIKDILDPDLMLRNITIEGIVFNKELRDLKKSALLTIMVKDSSGTIICKTFTGFNNQPPKYEQLNTIQTGMSVRITGKKSYDKYINDEVLEISSFTILSKNNVTSSRIDEEKEKRIELHVHSKMSKNNGINAMDEYGKMAKHFGHEAIAITDHSGVQGFVEAEKTAKKYGIKIVYGVEAAVVDTPIIVRNSGETEIFDETYTIFDLETTGLSANYNKIIEIGAVKLKNGQIIDRFQQFINIEEKLSNFTTELTGITNDDIKSGIELKDAIQKFKLFYKETTLVAHNATFDYQFLNKNEIDILGKEIKDPVLDTLELSRILNPENTFHSLKILSRKYGVPMDTKAHHRADYDSEKLAEIFILMLKQMKDNFPDFTTLKSLNKTTVNKTRGFHELLYVKNQQGLADLYKLISDASTTDFLMEPRIRKEYLDKNSENLFICGSGCVKSKLIDYYLNKSSEEIDELIKYYDYIDLNPPVQYTELIKNGTFKQLEEIEQMHENLIIRAKKVGTKVFASSNAHFIEPELAIIKNILLSKDYKPEKVKINKDTDEETFTDKIKFSKIISEKKEKYENQFYHTTQEMYDEFKFLDPKIQKEIIVNTPHELVDNLDTLQIIPDELFTPEIPGVEEKLQKMVWDKTKAIYGNEIPDIVKKRVDKELNSIIKYGFSVIYYISHKLVKYSLDNGYLVGSRGSVGSSLVATLMDITEINPLAPHYICTSCFESQFYINGEYASGFDLPTSNCQKCDIPLKKDGQDIPFETFLGFEGDKVPDIDLNFSGNFQNKAHDYVRSQEEFNDPELFDYNHAFRAGTIGTIAEKTAYAYTRNYFELLDKDARKSDILYYSRSCEGIKRTTGQHPGGIIVVPTNLEIYNFTPIQFPADDKKQPWRTTHFDFHAIHDNLLKLDILGHDDPTILKKLFDLTGIDPTTIDVSDEKIMELFSSTKSLGIEENDMFELGTMGVPEFGTEFVMGMLKDTKPKTFSELVQISGLSHGTDVWLGNAKNLIEQNICELKDVIGCRDDIMVYLMHQGVNAKEAFSIMENVRKGKGLTNEEIKLLKAQKVADWYIDSCQRIKYMFPKAHAAAYVLMALRIAYYKVYYPLEYYCAYFSARVNDFEPIAMIKGEDYLKQRINMIDEFENEMSEIKKKALLNSLKMSLEMVKRGFSFEGFKLDKSEAFEFVVNKEDKTLIMPFGIIDGLGEKEAIAIVSERNQEKFATKEDLKKRTKIKNKSLEQLEYFDVLIDLEESNQLSLF